MMKKLVCLLSIFTAVCVLGFDVPTLPPSEYADTEVSTNFALAVGEGGGRRLVFSLELEATPTNNVESPSPVVATFAGKTRRFPSGRHTFAAE